MWNFDKLFHKSVVYIFTRVIQIKNKKNNKKILLWKSFKNYITESNVIIFLHEKVVVVTKLSRNVFLILEKPHPFKLIKK